MERITNLLGERRSLPKKKRSSERGDMYDTILAYVNPGRITDGYPPLTYSALGYHLQGIPTRDLYALVSKMRDGERRGVPAGAIFWSEIRAPRNI